MDFKKLKFATRQIHAGLNPGEPTGSRGLAIYPTAAYRFQACVIGAKVLVLSEWG